MLNRFRITRPPEAVLTMGLLMLLSFSCAGANDSFWGGTSRLSLGAETVRGDVASRGRAELQGTRLLGNLNAAGRVSMQRATVEGHVRAGGRLLVEESEILGNVNVAGRSEMDQARITGSLKSAGELLMRESEVEGDVMVSGVPHIESSRIRGTLITPADVLKLNGAVVHAIRVRPNMVSSHGAGVVVGHGNNVVVNGGGSIISSRSGNVINTLSHSVSGRQVSVGPGSLLQTNGYRVSATSGETTVVTPDGSIYVNGQHVYGAGPKSYDQWRKAHYDAPNIQGPGWSQAIAMASGAALAHTQEQALIVLAGNSLVTGTIHFEGGGGRVVVEPGSRFLGTVEGGVLERL